MVPAAGGGSRMRAARPKQYLRLKGRALIEWSLQPLLACRWIRSVVVVLPPGDRRFRQLPVARDRRIVAVAGGATRAQSVMAGLEVVARLQGAGKPYVLVHDAARPGLRAADLRRLRDEASDRHGGLLAVPSVNTLKQAQGGRALQTLDREHIWQAQTPQMFRLDLLQQALDACEQRHESVTDEASAMERQGFRPRLVLGSAANLKVTYPEDLRLAAFWLEHGGRA